MAVSSPAPPELSPGRAAFMNGAMIAGAQHDAGKRRGTALRGLRNKAPRRIIGGCITR
jgi:hypothetical protein